MTKSCPCNNSNPKYMDMTYKLGHLTAEGKPPQATDLGQWLGQAVRVVRLFKAVWGILIWLNF